METDPASLDPELRTNKFLALMSASLGLLSLCAAIVPFCGGLIATLGLFLGMRVLRSGRDRLAVAGIALCVLGLLISVVYTAILAIKGPGQ